MAENGFCMEIRPKPCVLLIFGAAGDLAQRKLFPALFHLHRRKLLPPETRIGACLREEMTSEAFRSRLGRGLIQSESVSGGSAVSDEAGMADFLARIECFCGDFSRSEFYLSMKKRLEAWKRDSNAVIQNRIHYFAVSSDMYSILSEKLYEHGMTVEEADSFSCAVFEKPFGLDLESFEKLDRSLHLYWKESQIYRIDHYLGKDTVQNLLMFRFANTLFEPLWNRNWIESVGIRAEETLGVENRVKYWEKTGLLRDMFQNHMLQILSLVCMECPSVFNADGIRDEEVKLIRSIRKPAAEDLTGNFFRGQYLAGNVQGRNVCAYRSEPGVPSDSMRETFVSARLFIDNWRWAGVPFYLRAGKRLGEKKTEIVIRMKSVPHSIFFPVQPEDLAPNLIVLSIQPEEGVRLSIQTKKPGPRLCIGTQDLVFHYAQILPDGERLPDAYERLLLDCMLQDAALFIRSDCIREAWALMTPVLEAWNAADSRKDFSAVPLLSYAAGSAGPREELQCFRDSPL